MDLTIDVEDYKLNVRAAVVITHKGKILVHKNLNSDHYALIGGRVEIGEDSETTVKRELLEEIGKEIEVTGDIATVENFFEMKDSKNLEGKEYLRYEWIELDKLENYRLLPECMKDVLSEKTFPVHKIFVDKNGKEVK